MSLSSDSEPVFAAFVALDWGDKKHFWALQCAESKQRERGEIEHTPEAIDVWAGELSARFGGRPIAVALEQSRGALVFMLSKYAHLHLYPIHPTSAGKLRAALFPSGVKDDPLDADVLLEMLVQHRSHLRRLDPDSEPTRLIQNLVEARRRVVDDRTREGNRLIALLKLYFPQMLQWFDDVRSPLVGAWLKKWPTLEQVQSARPATVRKFLTQHNCRSEELIEKRLESIRTAMPALRDQAVIRSSVVLVQVQVDLLATVREAIRRLDREIEQACAGHPDFALFDSFPGAGPALAPRLLAAFGSRRDRYASVQELQSYCGIAPLLVRSGKSEWIHYRWVCPKFLRQTFHEWAGHSIAYSVWARAYYDQQRAGGSGHHEAVRALAFKWIRIAFRCWQDGQPYDEARYIESLRKRGSPLAAALKAA